MIMDIAKQIVDQRVNKIIEENTRFFEIGLPQSHWL